MSAQAYVWRRQFSWEQLVKIQSVRWMRERFRQRNLQDLSRFARCQLRDAPGQDEVLGRERIKVRCDGKWDGKRVAFEVTVRPLVKQYAIDVYARLLAAALRYYPTFTRWEAEDGPLVGERRLVFPDRLDEAAAYWMRAHAWRVMEDTDVAVAETCVVSVRKGAPKQVAVDLTVDRVPTPDEVREELVPRLGRGGPLPVDPKPRKCDPNAAIGLFTELSLPELVLLNWEQVRKPPTAADRALHEAIGRFDHDGVRAALAHGADPNGILDEASANAPLTRVASFRFWWQHESSGEPWAVLQKRYPGPSTDEIIRMIDLLVEAGAALDWAPPNEHTPLAEAALNGEEAVVRHLLALGADPSIRCHTDDHPAEMGSAWDYAAYHCDEDIGNDDRSAWDALAEVWPEPFGQVRKERRG